MEDYIKVFSGSEVEVIKVRIVFDQNNIKYIERNDIQSGVVAGFGTIDKAVHVFVSKYDYNRALELLQDVR